MWPAAVGMFCLYRRRHCGRPRLRHKVMSMSVGQSWKKLWNLQTLAWLSMHRAPDQADLCEGLSGPEGEGSPGIVQG
jgi:hypothetical protein